MDQADRGPGTLYVCPTPIGNLRDITLRCIDVLSSVDRVAAEDTRHVRKLLTSLGIITQVVSCHEHSRRHEISRLVEWLRSGLDIALVSDAGTPGISDPGARLIGRVIDEGLPLEVLPGPSAILVALLYSGLPLERFVFEGFLPRKQSERQQRLHELRGEQRTIVVFEAPHRICSLLDDIEAVLGSRRMAVARELTKVYEEVVRGTPGDVKAHLVERDAVRGEFTVVIAGAEQVDREVSDCELCGQVEALVQDGLSHRDAVAEVARRSGISRNRVYRVTIGKGGHRSPPPTSDS